MNGSKVLSGKSGSAGDKLAATTEIIEVPDELMRLNGETPRSFSFSLV